MKATHASLYVAVLGGLAMLVSADARAAQVGTYGNCGYGGTKTSAITTAGHTERPLANLNPASLTGLAALILENCNGGNLANLVTADVKAANSSGMLLVIDDWNPGGGTAPALPGSPALTWTFSTGAQIDLVPGMPYITGAGGTLTNDSLDGGGASNHGYTSSPMPVGVQKLLTTADPSRTVAIAYAYGSGRVVYSAMPNEAWLPGSPYTYYPNSPGVLTYMTNILSNSALVTTTCASEGYTGTKLTWCRNICEMGYTGATLDMWIHRWINRYRDLPYCAQEGGGEEEPPQEN